MEEIHSLYASETHFQPELKSPWATRAEGLIHPRGRLAKAGIREIASVPLQVSDIQ